MVISKVTIMSLLKYVFCYNSKISFVSFHGRWFTNVPVLVNNLGLLEQLSYWKVSAPCSAAGYSLTMKKHRFTTAHIQVLFFP